jgi:hypothetical protein
LLFSTASRCPLRTNDVSQPNKLQTYNKRPVWQINAPSEVQKLRSFDLTGTLSCYSVWWSTITLAFISPRLLKNIANVW